MDLVCKACGNKEQLGPYDDGDECRCGGGKLTGDRLGVMITDFLQLDKDIHEGLWRTGEETVLALQDRGGWGSKSLRKCALDLGVSAATLSKIKNRKERMSPRLYLKALELLAVRSPAEILFIGEHPKGHEVAFDPSTLSGKRLRTMVAEAGIKSEYMNLWESAEEQAGGKIRSGVTDKIIDHQTLGGRCVALGKRVHNALLEYQFQGIQCLPHPAARRKEDIEALRDGIRTLSK